MGNCMERSCMQYWDGSEVQLQGHEEGLEEKSGRRLKVVLSKKEVEWLIHELKSEEKIGKRSLEDVLDELERRRRWRPSLESIVEGPEVIGMDRDDNGSGSELEFI